MNKANNRQDAVNGRRATNVVEQHAVAVSDSLSKPMFLSDQFEAYLKVVEMELDGRVQRLVDLRSLHEKLGVKRDFTHWVKDALTNSKSSEGVDYSHVVRDVRREHGATQRHDYYASFETTKIIAARSNTDHSIDICKWLDRLMIQTAVAQAVVAVPAAQPAPVSDSLSKPMFLSDQFEAYLKVVEMELDGRVQRLVDLRSLHEKLGVKSHYKDWAPRSLTNSRSVEGVHYSPLFKERTVPHSSGRAQRKESKDYFVCFEKAKIIAARSDAENSLDICEWLVRVEDQVRQQTTPAPQISRLEVARELVAALEREEAEEPAKPATNPKQTAKTEEKSAETGTT